MSKTASDLDALFSANQKAMDEYFRTQLHTWEDLSKLQGEFANLWLECLNAQIQRVSSARDINDICATEAGLATEYSMKFSDNIRKVYETLLNAQKEYMKCVGAPEVLSSIQNPPARTRTEKPGQGKSREN